MSRFVVDWSVYLAMRERLPIATRDRALKAAAQAASVAEFAATTPR